MTEVKKLLMGGFIGLGLLAGSCSSDSEEGQTMAGSGSIQLGVTAKAGFTRAVNEADYQNTANYTVQIVDNEDKVTKEFLYKDKESTDNKPIQLKNGSYTVKAFYGTDTPASRDGFYVEGSTTVIVNGDTHTVNVDCYPTHGKAIAYFDPTMDNYFSDYSVVYETKALSATDGTAIWAKTDTEPWYLKVDKEGEEITANINFTRKDDNKSTTIKQTYKLLPNKAWTLSIYPKDNNGSLSIEIIIDESTNDEVIDIIVPSEWI